MDNFNVMDYFIYNFLFYRNLLEMLKGIMWFEVKLIIIYVYYMNVDYFSMLYDIFIILYFI